MSGFVVRGPDGVELLRTSSFDNAFSFRAGWNCRQWDGAVCQVFAVDADGVERPIDRVQLMADALGVDVATLGRLS